MLHIEDARLCPDSKPVLLCQIKKTAHWSEAELSALAPPSSLLSPLPTPDPLKCGSQRLLTCACSVFLSIASREHETSDRRTRWPDVVLCEGSATCASHEQAGLQPLEPYCARLRLRFLLLWEEGGVPFFLAYISMYLYKDKNCSAFHSYMEPKGYKLGEASKLQSSRHPDLS